MCTVCWVGHAPSFGLYIIKQTFFYSLNPPKYYNYYTNYTNIIIIIYYTIPFSFNNYYHWICHKYFGNGWSVQILLIFIDIIHRTRITISEKDKQIDNMCTLLNIFRCELALTHAWFWIFLFAVIRFGVVTCCRAVDLG